MSQLMSLGLQLMGYGLLGVFAVLAAFILLIHMLVKLFSAEPNSSQQ